MNETLLIRAYRGLTRLSAPLLPLWLGRRARAGKEDTARQGERFGEASRPRPDGHLIWMHGASVGEVTMLLPLIDKTLREYPSAHVLITSGTVTSAQILEQRLPAHAFHQYVPLDTPKAAAKFLNHWQPDLALWAESEIWPNLILEARNQGIPMALVNARMSDKSIQGWMKRPKSAKAIFDSFDLILAANEETANGLSWLLGQEIESAGNLKDAAPSLPVHQKELSTLRAKITARPIWCAASTHAGEDAIMLQAHAELRESHPNALLILAPRHPDRRDEILRLLGETHLAIRSRGEMPRAKTSVYLFDTIGEMGLAFSLADIAFVCGSTVDGLMGHNPLEPARLGCAVLTGAHIASFADSYMSMFAFDAAKRILSPDKIGESVSDLFSDPKMLAHQQTQALAFAQSRDAVLEYVWEKLTPILPPLSQQRPKP